MTNSNWRTSNLFVSSKNRKSETHTDEKFIDNKCRAKENVMDLRVLVEDQIWRWATKALTKAEVNVDLRSTAGIRRRYLFLALLG